MRIESSRPYGYNLIELNVNTMLGTIFLDVIFQVISGFCIPLWNVSKYIGICMKQFYST